VHYFKYRQLDYNALTGLVGARTNIGRLSVTATYQPAIVLSRDFGKRLLTTHRFRLAGSLPFRVRGVTVEPMLAVERVLSNPSDYRAWSGIAGVSLVAPLSKKLPLLAYASAQYERRSFDAYFPDLVGPNIVTEDLFDHPFTCIVRKDHPTIGDTLSLEQFLAADHIVVNQQGRSQEIFERRIRELKLQRRVVLHLPHFMSVPQLIATSDMIATVPFSLGAWYANAGLKLLPPPVSIPLIELKQHWHRRMDNEPAVRWLQSIVAEELRDRDPALAMSTDYSKSRAKAAGPAIAARSASEGKSRRR